MYKELKYKIQELINLHQEGEYWDFKKEWYDPKKDSYMLVDIISMANNLVNRDAYIIIGVDEADYSLVDVSVDVNRKNTQNLTDFLRSKKFAGDIRPIVTVETLQIYNKYIDVIVIHNSMNTPFYLKEGYHGLFANNIYVRLQDSNTPIDKSADINQVEYLWKKRFGLISTPNEKVLKYLEKHDDWISSPVYDDVRFYKYSPEYTIECTCDNDATAYEFYMFRQVDHTPHWYDIEIKFHQTVIDCCKAVSLDGGRYFTAAPNRDGISVERLHGWDVVFHYYIKGTLRYLLHKYYYEENKESCRYNHEDFIPFILIFDSENEKDSFKEYVHSNWEQYKETKNLDVLRISPMKGYNVEEFIKEDRDAQILQLMLRTFRKER